MNANEEYRNSKINVDITKEYRPSKAMPFQANFEEASYNQRAPKDPLKQFFAQSNSHAPQDEMYQNGFHSVPVQHHQSFSAPNMQVHQDQFMQSAPKRNDFQNRPFVNSSDLLVQQFLLENIQKRKGWVVLCEFFGNYMGGYTKYKRRRN